MLIKTCGLRSPDNIAELAALPIDWFGFIAYAPSSRYVGEDVAALAASLAASQPAQKRVGVFVNATQADVVALAQTLALDLVQLHGEETPAYCRELSVVLASALGRELPLIKAFRVGSDFDFAQTEAYAPHCAYFLFDTKGKTHGGTGRKFDWGILAKYRGKTPFLLSGGIGPTDAAAVQTFTHPSMLGIDLNSRFEIAPAHKDVVQLSQFVKELKVHAL